MQNEITQALRILEPQFLQVENESHMHSRGDNTHFKVVMASQAFAGLSRIQRHQRVFGVLEELMPQIYSLTLHLYTVEEWAKNGSSPDSPKCLGGSLHDL